MEEVGREVGEDDGQSIIILTASSIVDICSTRRKWLEKKFSTFIFISPDLQLGFQLRPTAEVVRSTVPRGLFGAGGCS